MFWNALSGALRALPLLFLTLGAVLAGPAVVIASADPARDGVLLVVSRWGDEAERVITAAGGQTVGPVRARFGVFATSQDPDFSDRLRDRGAWAVINGDVLAALCRIET
ncbi:MAG: hypothetical protein VX874_05420 [Pseudomonadota bacterium]|nr:hypothetical protein [Pseudomonadota bacterium]